MRRVDGSLRTGPRIAVLVVVVAGALLAAVLDPLALAFYLSYVIVGVFLVVRRPTNIVSWLMVAIAFAFMGAAAAPSVDADAVMAGAGDLRDNLVVWTAGWTGSATILGFLALTVLFPSGHLPDGRSRRPSAVLLGLGVLLVALTAFAPFVGYDESVFPNPFAILPQLPVWEWLPLGEVGVLIVVALTVIGVISMVVRYRRSTGIERLQLRWLVAAVAFVVAAIVFGLLVMAIFGEETGGLGWIPAVISYPTIPIAIGIAILRYNLYAIDRIVNRALVYGALTAILAGLFAAATALSQRLFILVTGETSDAGVVLTTLAVATLYAPVRARVETVVDRYFKYEQRRFGAYRDELNQFLELVEPVRAADRLAAEAMAETDANGAAVIDPRGDVIASNGTWPTEPIVTVPVAGGGRFTEVRLGPRHDGRPHDPARLAALAEVAALATAAADGSGTTLREERAPETAHVDHDRPAEGIAKPKRDEPGFPATSAESSP